MDAGRGEEAGGRTEERDKHKNKHKQTDEQTDGAVREIFSASSCSYSRIC